MLDVLKEAGRPVKSHYVYPILCQLADNRDLDGNLQQDCFFRFTPKYVLVNLPNKDESESPLYERNFRKEKDTL